jgi:hypothetical protein
MYDTSPLLSAEHAPPPTEAVEALLNELQGVLASIRQAHHELAEAPDPEGPREAELARLLDQRRQLSRELADALVKLLAAGGSVTAQLAGPLTGRVELVASPEPTLEACKPLEIAPQPPEPPLPPEEPVSAPAPTPTPAPAPAPEPAQLTVSEPLATVPSRATLVTPAPASPRSAPNRSQSSRPPSFPPAEPVRTEKPKPRPRKDLRGHLEAIGRPTQVTDAAAAAAMVARLVDATSDLDSWLVFPQDVQQALTGLASSIARHVQDEVHIPLHSATVDTLRAFFPAMTQWSKLYRPGFVPGLSRRFGPERDSWLEDAEHWWWLLSDLTSTGDTTPRAFQPAVREVKPTDRRFSEEDDAEEVDAGEALREVELAAQNPEAELGPVVLRAVEAGVPQRDPRLLRALRPHMQRLSEIPGLKTLKAALRATSEADNPSEASEDAPATAVPDEWPFFWLTEGKRAVIVGGDRRQHAADRIREAFRFANVEWEVKDARRLRALGERVRSKSVELVILLRGFIGHAEQETILDACRTSGIRFVVVDTGYGVNQVKLAIERFGSLPGTSGAEVV